MESEFILFLLFSFAANSSHVEIPEKHNVILVEEKSQTSLGCTGPALRGNISMNWMVKLGNVGEWKLIFSASEKKKFSGGAMKEHMLMTDSNFQSTGDFSLFLSPRVEDGGLYSCRIQQHERKPREKTFLLAVLKVSFYPDPPVKHSSVLRLVSRVIPDHAISKITWTGPGGLPMKTERKPNTGTVTKVPHVQRNDSGTYVCTVYPWGNSTNVLTVNVNVTVDADKVASFFNPQQDQLIHTGVQALKPIHLTCPNVQGDLVQLYWTAPQFSNKKTINKLVYSYDRWRGSTQKTSGRIQLAGPPYSASAGSFSFLLTPVLVDGGVFACIVFLNDNVFYQSTKLSVLKVQIKKYTSTLELLCQYSELSQVLRVKWEYQDKSRQLKFHTGLIGSISTTLPLPITANVTGNYTCVLQLQSGQVIRADKVITLPPEESVSVTTPSRLLSLSALLLLVPLVSAAVGVLLWRQKHISDRGIEQSLSVRSGETENLYENPEDLRQVKMETEKQVSKRSTQHNTSFQTEAVQRVIYDSFFSWSNLFPLAPPQGSVYMDLKPRGENDVYKELERYEQCQG